MVQDKSFEWLTDCDKCQYFTMGFAKDESKRKLSFDDLLSRIWVVESIHSKKRKIYVCHTRQD